MRYQVILSPYVKDLGKVVDTKDDEILCNADLKTALHIAACLEVCGADPKAAEQVRLVGGDPNLIKP